MSEEDKNKDEQSFSGDEKNEGFLGTPENYFDSFSARLFSRIKANEELKDYPLLSAAGRKNPFAVPADYFEMREELAQYPLLQLVKENAYTVPAGYFTTLPLEVANRIQLEGELNAYPALAAVEKHNEFVVPEDYFAEFAATLQETIHPPKVVPLYSRVLKQYKFAVAAAVALFLVMTLLLLNQQTGVTPQVNECKSFACLSKKDILNSGVIQNISEESLIDMIDINALSDSLSVKTKNGAEEKVDVEEVSDNIDVNTLTEEL